MTKRAEHFPFFHPIVVETFLITCYALSPCYAYSSLLIPQPPPLAPPPPPPPPLQPPLPLTPPRPAPLPPPASRGMQAAGWGSGTFDQAHPRPPDDLGGLVVRPLPCAAALPQVTARPDPAATSPQPAPEGTGSKRGADRFDRAPKRVRRGADAATEKSSASDSSSSPVSSPVSSSTGSAAGAEASDE